MHAPGGELASALRCCRLHQAEPCLALRPGTALCPLPPPGASGAGSRLTDGSPGQESSSDSSEDQLPLVIKWPVAAGMCLPKRSWLNNRVRCLPAGPVRCLPRRDLRCFQRGRVPAICAAWAPPFPGTRRAGSTAPPAQRPPPRRGPPETPSLPWDRHRSSAWPSSLLTPPSGNNCVPRPKTRDIQDGPTPGGSSVAGAVPQAARSGGRRGTSRKDARPPRGAYLGGSGCGCWWVRSAPQ